MTNAHKKTYSKKLVERVQVLIATMNREDPIKLSKEMRVNNFVIINQITKKVVVPKDKFTSKFKIVSVKEKGLSRSRNKAIENSNADVCMIADDDMQYIDNYEEIIRDGYDKYPDADIIAFYVDSEDPRQSKPKLKEGRLGLLKTMKIASCNITFRRENIVKSSIKFDENFGTGTDNYMGEENIFLFDCYRHGLKIYYIPMKIAIMKNSQSTWFTGYNTKYFLVKGRVFRRMAGWFGLILSIQFVIRKHRLYSRNISFASALKNVIYGSCN